LQQLIPVLRPCCLCPLPAPQQQGFALDNSWLDRLDMGFDLGDILSEGGVPSDGLVPTLSDVEPNFADLDASVPSLSMFNTEQEVQQQQQQAQAAPAAAAQPQQQFAPASVLPHSPMLGAGVHQHQVFGLVAPFPEYVPHAQQLEQQVPSLMQQQYVVRGDMVAALPQMSGMIPSMNMNMMPAPQHSMNMNMMSPQHSAQHHHQQQAAAAAPVRLSSNGGMLATPAAFTMGHNNNSNAATGPIRIVRYGDAAGETLSRAERVARYREKRKNRRFEKTIR
jgi:hypothetical protein